MFLDCVEIYSKFCTFKHSLSLVLQTAVRLLLCDNYHRLCFVMACVAGKTMVFRCVSTILDWVGSI